jgi:hypothetical protein
LQPASSKPKMLHIPMQAIKYDGMRFAPHSNQQWWGYAIVCPKRECLSIRKTT